MCIVVAPAVVAGISLATAAIGAGMTAYSAIQQGKQQKAMAGYQAAVSKNNATLAERAARDAEERGKIAEQNKRIETRRLIGRQRAVLAGNGVVVDTGSAAEITADTAGIGEFDALTIRDNSKREAYNLRAQRSNFEADAGMYKAAGSNAMSNAYLGAGGAALDGVSQVASKWYSFKREGAFG
jgi:hypothetical protein